MGKLFPEIEKTVTETQQLALDGLTEKGSPVRVPPWVDVVKQVANTPDELLNACLGETGKRLKRFAVRINHDHPDLEVFPDFDWRQSGQSMSNLFRSVSVILNQAKSQESIQNEEGSLPNAGNSLIRLLQQPRTRLLCGLQDRNEQRAIKRQVKNVGLKAALSGGENSFYGRPEHFKRFTRSSKYYIEEMRILEEHQTCFQKHGMPELSHVFAGRMRSLEESIVDTCGFFRIKPDEAAIILARLHGFKWTENGIIIPAKFFEEMMFWADPIPVVDNEAEYLKKTIILNTKFTPIEQSVTINFHYQARMYPLSHFPLPLPEMTNKIIDRAEHFALLNDSPFFDYYWVLVPSINMGHPSLTKPKDHWTIKDKTGVATFNDAIKAGTELDALLVKEGCIVPAILGERDGACYFVCHYF